MIPTLTDTSEIPAAPTPTIPAVPILASSINLGDIGGSPTVPAVAAPVQATAAPAVVNEGMRPSIDVSGYTLSSVLNLGVLLRPTPAA